jgi:glycosyltransferase involved in cell wall biosynthesis
MKNLLLIRIVGVLISLIGTLPAIIANDLIPLVDGERRIVVVTASYNNRQWYRKNLDSIFNQKYTNYYVIYIDDCSTDGTGDLVDAYINERQQKERIILLHNHKRCGTASNLYMAIHQCRDTDIVVIVDGDDWLAHANVFNRLNNTYADPNVWLTYGQFKEIPSGNIGFCVQYPSHIVQNNLFRTFSHIPSHLRTFYAGLFKKIKKEDLMLEGDFLPMTADMATMIPMIEMAGTHHKFISEVLLEYNMLNPINDHKVSRELQSKCDLIIRSRSVYSRILSPFQG